ncbi:aminotransferase-like domain-containing protein [Okibacterium fritillariae]|uniref:DNA-binding transcriptional regulator, MocR family, contains an aminotransferase domain n=1 Tax=Okibacterium fritillariae TaxID=123320 RepID=A0A1T5I7Q4_9MICO|nr:PLP-dependent aminotransferase family protein [Okibacterium fritillariae]SKC35206.1 DNA-binding transcriptional regulator, MocR family, contains an aminotransferase domain [Okibacterium fritillariae]
MEEPGTPRSVGNNLDPWYSNYAERTAGLSASEVRALFAVASRPEVVSLAGGMPNVSALPHDVITDSIARVMREQGATALQYGSGAGQPVLREQILEVMALEGIRGTVDNVVTTVGSQQALDLVTKLFIDPGDVILAEAPSYVGAIGVFRSYQASVVHVAMDDDGLIPDALRQTIAQLRGQGRRIKFLYTIPNFHNPAGITLSAERRPEILEICRANEILVVEDNPYGLLYFDHPAPDALRSIDDEGVIYLGSFSKTLAPGFRVGWVLAPHAIREKLILAAESAILSPSAFSQLTVAEYLKTADWKGQIDTFRGVYHERKKAMVSALAEYLPDLTWTDPNGGFYVWLSLPDQLDSKQMLPRAVKELVAFTPGTAFFADGRGRHAMRLSFCHPTPENIRVGIRRLATVINGEIDLLETFAGTGMLESRSSDRHVSTPPPNLN